MGRRDRGCSCVSVGLTWTGLLAWMGLLTWTGLIWTDLNLVGLTAPVAGPGYSIGSDLIVVLQSSLPSFSFASNCSPFWLQKTFWSQKALRKIGWLGSIQVRAAPRLMRGGGRA